MVDGKMRNEPRCVVPLSQEEVTILQMSLLAEKECHMKLCDGARRAGDTKLADSLRYYAQTVLPSLSTVSAGDATMSSSQLIGAWFAVERFYKHVVKPHCKAEKKNPVAFAMTADFGNAIAPTKPLLSKLADALSSCAGGVVDTEVVAVVVASPQASPEASAEVAPEGMAQGAQEENVQDIAEALRRLRNNTDGE